MTGNAALVEQRAYLLPVIRGAADPGRRVVETCRIGRAETVVELHCADDRGTTGNEGEEKWRKKAHDGGADSNRPPV